MKLHNDFTTEGLDGDALAAATAIRGVLAKHSFTDSNGGSRAFRRPGHWDGEYGKDSVLVTLYEGSDFKRFMSLDGYQYDLVEEIRLALDEVGMFHEECYTWHGAVYKSGE